MKRRKMVEGTSNSKIDERSKTIGKLRGLFAGRDIWLSLEIGGGLAG